MRATSLSKSSIAVPPFATNLFRATPPPVLIRPAAPSDAAAIAAILLPTIRAGATYALDPAMREADALAYWCAPDKETFVAEEEGRIVGTYYLRANQPGGGAHVCNCGYMTHPEAAGRGIAAAMAGHSSDRAGSGRCSSTSSSPPTIAQCGCGNGSASP
jgi:hypothetical protein